MDNYAGNNGLQQAKAPANHGHLNPNVIQGVSDFLNSNPKVFKAIVMVINPTLDYSNMGFVNVHFVSVI